MERLKKQAKSNIHHRRRSNTASDKENDPDDNAADDGGRLSVDDLDSDNITPERSSRARKARSFDDSDIITYVHLVICAQSNQVFAAPTCRIVFLTFKGNVSFAFNSSSITEYEYTGCVPSL